MIEKIVADCESALTYNLHFAALNLALTLPDICGKAESPDETCVKKRYVGWYNKHVELSEKVEERFETDDVPYLSGDVVYYLRCSMLHQGTPNTNIEKCNITKFELIIDRNAPLDLYNCSCDVSMYSDNRRELSINLRTLCLKLCSAARTYYKDNKIKFNFFNYYLTYDEGIDRNVELALNELVMRQT